MSCWGDRWYVNRREIDSLSKQAKRNAMAIKNSLDGVFREYHARIPWVNPILAFTNATGRLNIKSPTIPVLRSSNSRIYQPLQGGEFTANRNAGIKPSDRAPSPSAATEAQKSAPV